MPIADRNEQLQPGVPPSAPQFRHIVDALMSQPMARPRLGTGSPPLFQQQNHNTPLGPGQIDPFQLWKQQYAPQDSGQDYDFQGAYKAGVTPDPATDHWPDTFKKPNHPTFSDQSIYSSLTGTRPGTWRGETYIPFGSTMPDTQWKQGSVQDAQSAVLSHAIADDSPYGVVRALAKQDFDMGMAKYGGDFNKAMNYAGLGRPKPSSTQPTNRVQQSPVGYQNNPQLQALRTVIDALRAQAGSGTTNPSLFHEPTVTAGQGMGAAVHAAPGVLSDPRNAWLGFGPIAGMARPIGPFMRGWERMRESGGFTPPAGMLPNMPHLRTLNELASDLSSENPIRRSMARENYGVLQQDSPLPPDAISLDEIRAGHHALKAERDLALFGGGSAGGAVPPRSIMEDLQGKYGFGQQAQDALYEGYRQNSLPTTQPRPNIRKPKDE